MSKNRLDTELVRRQLVSTRSQAESYIKMGKVKVDGQAASKPGQPVSASSKIQLDVEEQFVNRAALKLAGVAENLRLSFKDKTVLDVGSSTGGFTDFALRRGAKKVIAVDVGKGQLHPSLHSDPRIELHEQTDIRDFETPEKIDFVLIDTSFISLRQVLPACQKFLAADTQVAALLKPQFEAGPQDVNKGIIKNDTIRRRIMKDFEHWLQGRYVLLDKADSPVAGEKGNRERFYLLRLV